MDSSSTSQRPKQRFERRPKRRHWGHIIAMVLITIFAVALMIASVSKGRGEIKDDEIAAVDDKPAAVLTKTVKRMPIEITDRYSGMIRPFERFTYAFENSGRVIEIAKNDRDTELDGELDEGDPVTKDQPLAYLDIEALVARREEVNAALEFSEQEYERALTLQQENERAINEAEVLKRNRDRLMNIAQKKTLEKQIKEATLRSTAEGVISKRWINQGETVSLQQPAFEVIQVDKVLLVVSVPEYRIHRIPFDERGGSESRTKVYVRFTGGEEFGSADPKPIVGEVYRIGQTSDENSGQFEVDILIENRNRKLRPGMIAIAEIVVKKVDGFQVPLSVTDIDDDELFLFTCKEDGDQLVASRFKLTRDNYEVQDDSIVVRELPEEYRRVIVSGQHRLVDGRKVNDIGDDTRTESEPEPATDAKRKIVDDSDTGESAGSRRPTVASADAVGSTD